MTGGFTIIWWERTETPNGHISRGPSHIERYPDRYRASERWNELRATVGTAGIITSNLYEYES